MARLDGKVALISGGARGMGAAEARRFVEAGATVAIGDVNLEEGTLVAKELGDQAIFLELDVTREASWAAAVDATVEQFGRLDVLVNNAGILLGAPIVETTLDDYLAVITVNQVGVFLGMRAVIPALTTAGGGSIINVSSIYGLTAYPGVVAYASSKFAVRGMTKVAAVELAPFGIRVNSIHPGFIDTPMLHDAGVPEDVLAQVISKVPQQRLGSADEVAGLALFLASDDSTYSTGAEFVADGGITCGIPVT